MRFVSVALLLLLSACGAKVSSIVKLGETTRADLLKLKGEPSREEKIPLTENTVLIYSEEESYQIKNDVVIVAHKSPPKEEKTLIFWKHKLKDCKTQSKKVPQMGTHAPVQMELDCPEEGMKVIYLEGAEDIFKVVEYAKE